jgi:DNA-binding NarL/FixJ family response regulator
MADGKEVLLMQGTTLHLAIASRSPLVRAGLAARLGRREGLLVVLAAESLAALRAASFGGAEVAVVDCSAAGSGDAAEPEFIAEGPRVIVLADPGDERIGEWLIDGCSVLPRDASGAQIAAAAEAARSGLVATPPGFAADALRYERVGERRSVPPGFDALTPRERQVLVEMSHGLGNREIGGALGISAHTAKFHVAQIIAKLDAQSRAHAVAKALRAGLVDV